MGRREKTIVMSFKVNVNLKSRVRSKEADIVTHFFVLSYEMPLNGITLADIGGEKRVSSTRRTR